MVAGFPFAFVLLQKVVLWPFPALDWAPPGDVRAWRMAHLEGILNGLTLIAIAPSPAPDDGSRSARARRRGSGGASSSLHGATSWLR
jgi:hypothetical protein